MLRLALLLLLLPTLLRAESLGRIEAVERALNNNLELRAARQTIAAAQAAVANTGRMPNPDLGLAAGANNREETEFEASFSQKFPITGRLRWERRLGELQVEAARFEVIAAEREIAQTAELAWWDLRAAQQRAAQLQELQGVLSTQAATSEESVTRGEASALDARRLRLAANSLDREIGEARIAATEASTQLAQALSLPPGDLPAAGGGFDLPAEPEPAANALAEDHPAVQAARLGLVQANAETALADAQRFQDIEGGVVLRRGRTEDAPEGFEGETFLGLQVSVPLPLWNDGRAAVQAARAVEGQRAAQIEAVQAEVIRRVASARAVVAERHRVAREFRAIVGETAETERLLREAWSQGEASLLEVIDARRELQRAQVESLDLDLAYHRAAAQLRVLALDEEPLRSRSLLLAPPGGAAPAADR